MASNSDFGYSIGEVLTENLDDLIFVLNENFECEFVNEKVHIAKLGYLSLRDKITGILHQDDLQIGNAFLQRLLKKGQAIEHLRVRQKDNYVYYEFKGKTFTNEKHEIKLLITSRDISQFKRSESEWLKKEEVILQTKDEKKSFQKSREMLAFELKYAEILANIREAYFEVDLKGNFTFMNKSFTQMIGYSSDEMIGNNYSLVMDNENKNKVFKLFNSVFESGFPQESIQFEVTKKGNKRVTVETSVYLRRDPSGRKIGFYGLTRDITQRFILEQKLKQSEEKYRHLFKSSPYAIWIVDLNGIIVDSNSPKNILISQNSSDDLIGKSFVEVLGKFERPEYFIPFFKSKFENFVKDTPMKALEFKMTRPDGIEKWVNILASKIKLGEDRFVQVLMQDITEKKIANLKLQRSEEELKALNKELEEIVVERTKEFRESEENFRTIAENSLMGVAILQDNKIKYVNQQFTTLAGYGLEEVKEFSPMDIFLSIHPDDRKLVMEQLRKKQRGLGDYISHYQYRILDKMGDIKWLDNYSKTINFMGRPADLVSAIDITDRKKAEQELKESEEKYRLILESAYDFISVLNEKFKFEFVNESPLFKILGYSSSELLGKSPLKFSHPDDHENILKGFKDRFEIPEGTTEARIKHKDGHYVWCETSGKVFTGINGEQKTLLISRDITERKRAEQELKESEEKYRHLYENSPFSIVLLDIEGKIIDMNSKTTELFGYEKEDLIGKNYLHLTGVYPSDTRPGLRLIPELISKGEPSGPIMRPQPIKIFNKEKKVIWVESELSTIKIGGVLVIQAIIQDVTEKKIAEEKLKDSERIFRAQNIELKELDRLKTDFISIAAHDLKTPLISVGGYIDLILLREKGLNEEVKEDLNRVLNNVHRLEGYINRLMDVMKIDAKKVELVKREENIHDIFVNCFNDLEFQIGQKNLTINVDIPENLKINLDLFRISQVCLNLLSNAVKFTPKDGKIDISVEKNEEGVVFSIMDNGKGLTSEEIQKIFGKFVTIEQGVDGYSTFAKGSGLGLYIAKGFIEAHGGKIWVESKGRNLGTKFSFILPKQ